MRGHLVPGEVKLIAPHVQPQAIGQRQRDEERAAQQLQDAARDVPSDVAVRRPQGVGLSRRV